MARAKYQVLVLPYQRCGERVLYCILKRRDMGVWQFIAGGGETEDPSRLASAKREAWEEAGISCDERYSALETRCSISTEHFKSACSLWGEACLVIPEYAFAVEVRRSALRLSGEHTELAWVDYATARQRLRYDSNRVALWELDNKIRLGIIQ